MITDLIDLLERLLQRSLLLLRHGPRVGLRLSPLPNQPSTRRTAHTPTLAPVERVRSERHTDTQRSDQGKSGWRPQGHRTTTARAPLAPPRTKPRPQQQDEREEDGRGERNREGLRQGRKRGEGSARAQDWARVRAHGWCARAAPSSQDPEEKQSSTEQGRAGRVVGGGRGASYRALLGYTAPLSDSVSRRTPGPALSCHSLT